MKYVIFNRRNEMLRVPVTKAMFYEAYGNYCYGVFPNKQKIMLPIGLSQVETLIAQYREEGDAQFVRIGKRFIVNMDSVIKVDVTQMQLVLSDLEHAGNFSLPMSKEALKQIRDLYTTEQIWK